MTAPAKPTIDEQIEELGNPIRQLYPVRAEYRDAILSTLEAYKRIMEAKRPEPVAWMWIDADRGKQFSPKSLAHQGMPNNTPLYGPDLLAYADRMRAERNSEAAIVDRIWDMFGRPTYAELDGKSLYDLIAKAQEDSRQLAELQAKHDALVKRLREPTSEMVENGVYAQEPNRENSGGSNNSNRLRRRAVRVFTAMSAVALRERGE